MQMTFDDYDEFEFDEAMRQEKDGKRRRPRVDTRRMKNRKRPDRYARPWADDELADFDASEIEDFADLDFDYDDSLNLWR